MSNTLDITSSNSTSVLTVEQLFPVGITLEMFALETAIEVSKLDVAETKMGIDGKMAAGFIPNIFELTINLEAASPSYESMSLIWSAMTNNRRVYECTLVSAVPSIGRVFTFTRGVLKSGVPFAKISKTLQPTSWVFNFEKMVTAAI